MSIKIQNGNLDVTSRKEYISSRIATSPGLIELTVEDSYNSYEIDFDIEGLNILVPAINISVLNGILKISSEDVSDVLCKITKRLVGVINAFGQKN
jgi:hypothetical protein